jgi:hypothetical protein
VNNAIKVGSGYKMYIDSSNVFIISQRTFGYAIFSILFYGVLFILPGIPVFIPAILVFATSIQNFRKNMTKLDYINQTFIKYIYLFNIKIYKYHELDLNSFKNIKMTMYRSGGENVERYFEIALMNKRNRTYEIAVLNTKEEANIILDYLKKYVKLEIFYENMSPDNPIT